MSQATQFSMNASAAYATSDDFCRVFSENVDRLYLLALLHTADTAKADDGRRDGSGSRQRRMTRSITGSRSRTSDVRLTGVFSVRARTSSASVFASNGRLPVKIS